MPNTTSPVLLDRLAKALDRQGVKMKRTKLLETAAHAFGYRSANAFAAAMEDDDFAPPAVQPIGKIELASGETLYVVRDPLANAPYAIDGSFVDLVVAEERAEKFGVSPYGHLVDVGALPDTVMTTMRGTSDTDATEGSVIRNDDVLTNMVHGLLTLVDDEIENRQAGGDPVAWAELKRLSDATHAVLRREPSTLPIDENDPGSIRISRSQLKTLIGAAESYAEDLSTGLDDGTYDDEADIEDVQTAIRDLEIRLSMQARTPSASVAASNSKTTIQVAIVTTRHGSDTHVAFTDEGLQRKLAEYCTGCWNEVADLKGVPSDHSGMADSEIVSTYFNAMANAERGEYVDYETKEVDDEPKDAAVASPLCARCDSPLAGGLCTDGTCPFDEVGQDDPRGWIGHPCPPKESVTITSATAAPVQTSVLDGKPNDWASQIATALEGGVASDIWYDADKFGGDDPEDADRIAESTIDETQRAMVEAAAILRELSPVRMPDGRILVDGIRHDPQRIASRQADDQIDKLRWITDKDGDDTGAVSIGMLAAHGLAFHQDRGETLPLTEKEYAWIGAGETLNGHLELPVKLGYSVLWQGRKWLAPEIEFAFPDQGDDSNDSACAARKAEAYMEHIRPSVEALGGQLHFFEDATDASHELTILLPFDLAEESASFDDWKAALSYLLLDEIERKEAAKVTCEFTAEACVNDYIMSVDPEGDTVWDGTFDALRWGTNKAVAVADGSFDADDYAYSPLAPKWVQDWTSHSPFTVQAMGLEKALRLAM